MWNQLYVESTQLLCWINLDSMWNQVYVKLTQLLCGIKSASPRICSRELLWGINQASFTEKSLCGFHPAGLMCNKLYVESTQLLLRICASQLLRWHGINPASLTKKSLCGINQLLLPTKKLLGSGFSTPYTTFCLICTISSELKCISHLFLSEWAGVFSFVPIRVSREIHSFSVDGFDTR